MNQYKNMTHYCYQFGCLHNFRKSDFIITDIYFWNKIFDPSDFWGNLDD